MRSCKASQCTVLVYILSLNFLALENLLVRSVAAELNLNEQSQSVFIPHDDQSTKISDGGSGSLIKNVPVVKRKTGKNKISKTLVADMAKAIAIIIGIAVLMIAISLMKKKKKTGLRRKLKKASSRLRKELFMWERLFDKNLDYDTFLESREKKNLDFIANWKHVFYYGNAREDTKVSPLSDTKLEEEKEQLWKRKIEPYYVKADFESFERLRQIYKEVANKLKLAGFRSNDLEHYNMFTYKPLTFDAQALQEFIDLRKANNAQEDDIAMFEFFLEHSRTAMDVCNNHMAARRSYYAVLQKKHVKLLSLGKD